jgi:hypothetical protein
MCKEHCSICLDDLDMENFEDVEYNECCKNFFHESCLQEWKKINRSCPLCRNKKKRNFSKIIFESIQTKHNTNIERKINYICENKKINNSEKRNMINMLCNMTTLINSIGETL